MKRLAFIIIILVFGFANNTIAQSIKAYLSYSRFYSEESGPYLETYLTILGNTMKPVSTDSGELQNEASVTLVFRQGEEVKYVDKYTLQSPKFKVGNAAPNLVDQQRIVLPNGKYEFEIILSDHNKPEKEFKNVDEVTLEFSNTEVQISDIQLVEDFYESKQPSIITKSGYDLVPFSNNYYPGPNDKLRFYAELYNTDKQFSQDEQFVIKTFVENADNRQVAADLSRFSKQKAEKVKVVLSEFPLEKLETGNYNLVVEVRNKENKLVADKRTFFQRSGTMDQMSLDNLASINTSGSFVESFESIDELKDHIRSTWPISTKMERIYAANQLNYSDLDMMQKYFYSFWQRRNLLNPQMAWNEYFEEVKKVDKEFSTSISKGYETDRGRVYLQYGPPNTLSKRYSEPSTAPYEIWHYYQIDKSEVNRPQSDKRFVFANVNQASNDFDLIHSDAYGETRNNRWQIQLQNRTDQYYNLDIEQGAPSYGNRIEDLYNNPR